MFTAATLTFVRTPAGVVRVVCGEPLPDNADAAHVEHLLRVGAVIEAQPEPVEAEAEQEEPAPVKRRAPKKGGRRGAARDAG